jgi:hypothetical protein
MGLNGGAAGGLSSSDPLIVDKVIDITIETPTASEAVNVFQVPDDITSITITKIRAYAGGATATVDYNLEERIITTPDTAGTDAIAADAQADNNGLDTTSFSNASFAAGTHAVVTTSAIANAPTYLKLQIQYTEVP